MMPTRGKAPNKAHKATQIVKYLIFNTLSHSKAKIFIFVNYILVKICLIATYFVKYS